MVIFAEHARVLADGVRFFERSIVSVCWLFQLQEHLLPMLSLLQLLECLLHFLRRISITVIRWDGENFVLRVLQLITQYRSVRFR